MSQHLLGKGEVAIDFDVLDATTDVVYHREDALCPCSPERGVREGETVWLHDGFYRPHAKPPTKADA